MFGVRDKQHAQGFIEEYTMNSLKKNIFKTYNRKMEKKKTQTIERYFTEKETQPAISK